MLKHRMGRISLLSKDNFPVSASCSEFQSSIGTFSFPTETNLLERPLIPFAVLSSKSTVEFTNAADGRHVELEVKGDWWDRSANITCGGQPVAHISRSYFNMREIFGDKQTVSVPFRT